jgi:hypothetical protein
VERAVFPALHVRGSLINLHAVDCDLRALRFGDAWFGRLEVDGCSFEACDLRTEYVVRKADVRNSSFVRCRLGGWISDVMLTDVEILACTAKDLNLRNVNLSSMEIRDTECEDITWATSTARHVTVTGRLRNGNWHTLTFDEVDLTNLAMQQHALVDPAGTVRLPQMRKSFVVPGDSLTQISDEARRVLSPRAFEAFENIVRSEAGIDPLIVDDTTFHWEDSPIYGGISPEEREALIALLYPLRLETLERAR